MTREEFAAKASKFVIANEIATLNVAGPRESTHAGAADYSRRTVPRLLELTDPKT